MVVRTAELLDGLVWKLLHYITHNLLPKILYTQFTGYFS